MAYVSPYHVVGSLISQGTDLTIDLGCVALALLPALENIVFILIKPTFAQWAGSRQR
jgi:hypothetical protein